jgi:hypothetical protein
MFEVYALAGRQTGRTEALINTLRDGDTVVVVSQAEGRNLQRRCKERGIDILVSACDTSSVHQLMSTHLGRSGPSRLVFDHMWVEDYYREELWQVALTLDRITAELNKGVVDTQAAMTSFQWSEVPWPNSNR